MANEKNVNVMESEIVTETVKTAPNAEKRLLLMRKEFESKDGKKMFSYLVKGKAYNRDISADFIAKDNGGYEVLDILFSVSDKVELVIRDEEMETDDRKIMKYTVYEAQTVDPNGNVLACRMKPQRDSDKSLLNMLLITM